MSFRRISHLDLTGLTAGLGVGVGQEKRKIL